MTTTNANTRQPTKLDYASPTQFRFSIIKLPKVEYFATAANIPVPGDKLAYSPLSMDFMVDENLENYREIHGWLTGVGFPKNYEQFQTLQGAGTDRFPSTQNVGTSKELGEIKKATQDDGGLYSDATLVILTSKNNANLEVRFRDLYPVSLSGLDYNQQETDIQYLTANVTFAYRIYEFATVNASGVVETTS